ncbi:MAG: polysaccharide deacetylase family protein [Candidatus Acidiferrales bacterium]
MNDLAWVMLGGVCAAGGVSAWGSMVVSSQIFGTTLTHTGDAGTMALTFDDGPNPAVTTALLDLLERYQAKGTFFVVGKHVRAFPRLTAEIVRRGHTIGNHTETHPRLNVCTPARTRDELDRCAEAIGEAANVKPRWMRPPYGYRSPWLDGIVRSRFQSQVVMWSRMARDWAFTDPEPVIQRLRRTGGGDIVVLHDGDHRALQGKREHVLVALEYWLPRWKDRGLRFLSMDEVQAKSEVMRPE